MALKDIVLHVDAADACRARTDVAIGLAARDDAHLTGLYVHPRLMLPVGFAADLPPAFIEAETRRMNDEAARAQAEFESACKQAGVHGEWRATHGEAADALIGHGRYADLVVVGQSNTDDPQSVRPGVPDDVVIACGRPVLVVPWIGAARVPGQNVVVAWNASRESARAVNDALPILRTAEQVSVLVLDVDGDSTESVDMPGADITLHLARHGVRAEAQHIKAGGVDVGNLLLSRVADNGADLIVMGAYGHSRLREWLLGGVTRELLEHMTVPVMLAH